MNAALVSLRPLDRVRFLARRNPFELALSVVGLLGALYVISTALTQLWPSIGQFLSWSARAQNPEAPTFPTSSRDLFDWYIALLMGVVLIISVSVTYLAKSETKITFGQDMTRMIVGFLVGFLSGGKPR